VRVGVLEEATKTSREEEGSPLTLLEVAAIHEFGAPAAGIPQRSFIRAGVDAQLPEIQRVQRALAAQTIRGALTLDVALDRLGAKVAALLQNRIAAGIDPPNSAATIARKGSSKPLVDTGQLKAAITWRVLS
jgi:phage gpG-like protein